MNQVPSPSPSTYLVVDGRTGEIVGRFKNKRRARGRRDKLDLQYGAVRYGVREVPASISQR